MTVAGFSFDLCGDLAFFKKNDTNDTTYISYNFIHKPVLLGIMGAILGLKGYSMANDEMPEYYQLLHQIKLAIIPQYTKPLKKVITVFNNSCGLGADMPSGGSWQIPEQILIGEPEIRYKIIILEDEINKEHLTSLKERLKKNETDYPIYFGKNEFFAYYDNFKEFKCEVIEKGNTIKINSLFEIDNDKNILQLKEPDINEFNPFNLETTEGYAIYERLPYDFDENGFYKKKLFVLTDRDVIVNDNDVVYKVSNDKESLNVQFI